MTTDMRPGSAEVKRGNAQLTREALYELVWAQPMLKVGAQFGVSSSYMARVCSALNVPRPERGYWAKLAFGKAPAVPALPDARPGDQLAWSPGGRTSRTGSTITSPASPRTQEEIKANTTPLPDHIR